LVDRPKLIALYARLKGLERAVLTVDGNPHRVFGTDFNAMMQEIQAASDEDVGQFILGRDAFFGEQHGRGFCHMDYLTSRIMQATNWLEYSFHLGAEVVEIGTLYNAIRDEELKARCADLLSAPGKFDRVINQATQVLEDRIRSKAQLPTGVSGVSLVNRVVKANPAQITIKLSDDPDEQEGLSQVLRGLILAFRNPTHHQLLDHVSREDALKVCAFIDNLLTVIAKAELQKKD
jgi:uncharacterized protein (TIGR02391 family)